MSRIMRLSFLVFVMVATSAIVVAQSTVTGAIGGSVSNPNKEVVPGAAVTVRSTETNKEDSATTDDQGRFLIPQLAPGIYLVTVNATGFNAFSQDRVVVEVGRVTNLEVPLAIGQVTGNVEVTAEAPVINTSQQDFSSNINQTSINELPINGRRASNFVLLTPGVAPDGDFGLISFRGISGLLNNSTVDGGDNNNAFYAEEAGRTRISYSTSQSAVREFQVNTSNYSAEYGRAAGGVINTVTKSGTNEFHGDLFYYNRDNKLGARNPRGFQTVLINNVPTPTALKPVDKRQQFGGTIGGPIVKDKLFFFFSYDQQKRNFPGIANFSSANFLNTINRTNLTATNRGLTNAQIDAGRDFLISLSGEVPRSQDQYVLLPKIDWQINSSNTFSAVYNRLRSDSPAGIQTQPTVTRGRASFGDDFVDIDSLTMRLSSTITPTLLNEARVKIGREFLYAFSNPPASGEPTTGPEGRPPSVAITGGLTFGKPNFLERRANPKEDRLQFADTVTLSRGNHTFKFGGDVNRVKDLLDNLFAEGGVYSYSNINDFLVDYTNFTSSGALRTGSRVCSTSTRLAGNCYTSSYQQAFGDPSFEMRTTDINFFAQDDWRWSPRLTVNLGLRYELQQMPKTQNPNPLLPQYSTFPTDKDNFGPRGGFAYDLTGDGKTSVRGGLGVYYGRVINSTIMDAITDSGVDRGQVNIFCSPTLTDCTPDPIFPNTLPTPAFVANPTGAHVNGSSVVVLSPRLRSPMIIQSDFVVEREIARNTVISASYIASRGRGLPTYINVNLAPPTTFQTFTVSSGQFAGQSVTVPIYTTRLDTRFFNIAEVRSQVDSVYHAFVLQFNRRLTNGLQFQVNYTRSKATDNGQTSETFTPFSGNTPTDPFNLDLDKGRTRFDIPHRFIASAVWAPKLVKDPDNKVARAIFNGFSLAPIVTLQSGRPYSADVSGRPAGALNSTITGSNGFSYFIPLGRNSFQQPKIFNVDMRLSRRFHFTESTNLEFLVEAFNLFNRTHKTAINDTAFDIVGTSLVPRASFGEESATGNTLFRERQVQWAARFHF
ncbi:MAG: TonB-dependent receptor [Pyrinomonadaceae bacterium]|nr:TonB-dependent receptor [Pyrinomonadaceae bacterium]